MSFDEREILEEGKGWSRRRRRDVHRLFNRKTSSSPATSPPVGSEVGFAVSPGNSMRVLPSFVPANLLNSSACFLRIYPRNF